MHGLHTVLSWLVCKVQPGSEQRHVSHDAGTAVGSATRQGDAEGHATTWHPSFWRSVSGECGLATRSELNEGLACVSAKLRGAAASTSTLEESKALSKSTIESRNTP
jgi:hypothetical protein